MLVIISIVLLVAAHGVLIWTLLDRSRNEKETARLLAAGALFAAGLAVMMADTALRVAGVASVVVGVTSGILAATAGVLGSYSARRRREWRSYQQREAATVADAAAANRR